MYSISRRQLMMMFGTGALALAAAACGGGAPASSAPPSSPAPSASLAAGKPSPASPTSSKPSSAPAASPASSAAAKPGLTTVKISDIQITSAAGSYIAAEKGYFSDEGIQPDFVTVPTAQQVTALLTGTVDVAGTVLNNQLYNAMARGVTFKMVADHGANLKNASAGGVIIRKDLVDSGKFKGPANMKGLNVFHAKPPNVADIALEKYLKQGGLTLKDIVNSPIQNFADVIPAFANKAVDVAYFQEPFSTIAVTKGLAVRGPIGYDVYPNQQIATLVFNQKLSGDVAIRYLKAYTRGVRDYVKAFLEKDKTMFDQVVPILIKHTTVKDRTLFEKAIPSGLRADPVPDTRSILDDFDWFVSNGYVKQKFDLSKYIDLDPVKEAIKQVGPAK